LIFSKDEPAIFQVPYCFNPTNHY